MPYDDSQIDGEIHKLVHRIHTMRQDQRGYRIAFIAARAGEGTSTLARDFAEGIANETGRKILIVDAGPVDRERFITDGIDPAKGIVDAVAGGGKAEDAIFQIDYTVHLGRWLGQDRHRSVATRLLNDPAFWQGLQEQFDTIVIDAPSLQHSSEGIALAAKADAVALVIESETTRLPVIEKLRDTLNAAGANVIGAVMNKRRLYIPEKVYARL
jgi:Mrp family chromosome partitioning ATPase